MKTITTRTYTNVALTVIMLLLLFLTVKPLISIPAAHAQLDSKRNAQQTSKISAVDAVSVNAEATREIAQANREIAKAIDKLANTHKDVARALTRLVEVSQ